MLPVRRIVANYYKFWQSAPGLPAFFYNGEPTLLFLTHQLSTYAALWGLPTVPEVDDRKPGHFVALHCLRTVGRPAIHVHSPQHRIRKQGGCPLAGTKPSL